MKQNHLALKVEGLSKQYRLGTVGTGSLMHDVNRWFYKVRGKEDPYTKIGDTNDRTVSGGDYVWALKDINFEVKQGEVLGIIGKNGAGKSTLLKLLSKITGPTSGSFKVNGRIASLLEVGTGFHPELTGRENIYLNGAILGMTKSEVTSKLDEIIDFSGCAKYVDTPVKRYSSGMIVRLGFAVAAHLEPDILIVDEVLAVGDMEFQKKCIGKMKEVSGEGRTVLFVSHNMSSIKNLCETGLLLDKGQIANYGTADKIVTDYMKSNYNLISFDGSLLNYERNIGTQEMKFSKFKLDKSSFHFKERIDFEVSMRSDINLKNVIVGIKILNNNFETVCFVESSEGNHQLIDIKSGETSFKSSLMLNLLPGEYFIELSAYTPKGSTIDLIENAGKFEVLKSSIEENLDYRWAKSHGFVYENIKLIES